MKGFFCNLHTDFDLSRSLFPRVLALFRRSALIGYLRKCMHRKRVLINQISFFFFDFVETLPLFNKCRDDSFAFNAIQVVFPPICTPMSSLCVALGGI